MGHGAGEAGDVGRSVGRGPCSGNSPDELGDSPLARRFACLSAFLPASLGLGVCFKDLEVGIREPREQGAKHADVDSRQTRALLPAPPL